MVVAWRNNFDKFEIAFSDFYVRSTYFQYAIFDKCLNKSSYDVHATQNNETVNCTKYNIFVASGRSNVVTKI